MAAPLLRDRAELATGNLAASVRLLYCFIVLRHDRRRVIRFNDTAHPTAGWSAQQVVEAFLYDEAPRFLIRDRDAIYGHDFRERGASPPLPSLHLNLCE